MLVKVPIKRRSIAFVSSIVLIIQSYFAPTDGANVRRVRFVDDTRRYILSTSTPFSAMMIRIGVNGFMGLYRDESDRFIQPASRTSLSAVPSVKGRAHGDNACH